MSHCTVDRQHRGFKLHQTEKRKLETLLREFTDMLSVSDDDLGRTTIVKHQIDVGDVAPVRQPPRRLPFHQWEVVQQHVDKMLGKTESWTFQRALVLTSWTQWRSNVGMNHKTLPIALNKPHHSATKILVISNMLVRKVFPFLFNVH